MKLTIHLLSAFCVLYQQAESTPIFDVRNVSYTEIESLVGSIVKTTDNIEQEFYNSMMESLNNMKDTSTHILDELWQATFSLIELLYKEAETEEEKNCIDSGAKNIRGIMNSVTSTINECVENFTAIGKPIQKKIQKTHQNSINSQEYWKEIGIILSTKTDESSVTEYIAHSAIKLEASLEDLAQQIMNILIEAYTMKPKQLSDAMRCNAKVVTEVHGDVLKSQENLRECIL